MVGPTYNVQHSRISKQSPPGKPKEGMEAGKGTGQGTVRRLLGEKVPASVVTVARDCSHPIYCLLELPGKRDSFYKQNGLPMRIKIGFRRV